MGCETKGKRLSNGAPRLRVQGALEAAKRMLMELDAVTVATKWPSSNPPRIGDEYLHAGQLYRILSVSAADGTKWRWRSVVLTLEPAAPLASKKPRDRWPV